ncbi:YbdD/YjiX family protein [Nocardia miyunensis]|uniref:YbdD/YjiX family protein n=1 Tax=Nocardia miyunensis TaxID=282684 RepID=UPI000A62261B
MISEEQATRRRGRNAIGLMLRAGRTVAGYVNAVLGGRDYARYVEHLRRKHPGCPIPTERDYWRERYAAADRNPATRCC